LIVAAEKKMENGHANVWQLVEQFQSNLALQGGVLKEQHTLKVNQYSSFQGEAEWTVDGNKLVYLVTFIDTPDTLYKIYCWTLASQKEYLSDFRKAVDSFSLIEGYSYKQNTRHEAISLPCQNRLSPYAQRRLANCSGR
jgi:hypothetical protein